ncbi:methylaspartate mutase accessory protein GlmL [Clostridium grantii]|uniref:MutL protein n=1 Tax=Clostridium grantii DSM 8605 TaxID=1121316 RepID=A0A1M5QKS4_9CLOT|nr:methylaspartate mutase accessory protein GlmL [Clostridium grantii]SHH14654.1 conserved hypothetical protein [Clostridium grantii DSM 8605]
MKPILLIDFGSTYTKITAVDIETSDILGTSKSFTTINTDIAEGLSNALKILELKIGKIDYIEKFACSSAAGGLKMVAVGLVPDLTAEAAKRAALSAGAKVIKVFSYELNKLELQEIEEIKPDIVLLTGGTDGGNTNTIIHNAKMISQAKYNFPVIVAGNKTAANEVETILEANGKEATIVENVMPKLNFLNIESARNAIRELFLKRIIEAKGFTKIKTVVEGILMPTPSAVLSAATLLANGFETEEGLGELIIIDIGGATTDVHSLAEGEPSRTGVCLKGLKEPFDKRTVEGDLGLRYSARALIDSIGIEDIVKLTCLSIEKIEELVKELEKYPEKFSIPGDSLSKLETALSKLAVKEAINRHVGRLETQYTPFGAAYVQEGKDLTNIEYVIGTGGPIINSLDPLNILKEVAFEKDMPTILKPIEPKFLLDDKYILAAMGLLAEKYPLIALKIMKKEITNLL